MFFVCRPCPELFPPVLRRTRAPARRYPRSCLGVPPSVGGRTCARCRQIAEQNRAKLPNKIVPNCRICGKILIFVGKRQENVVPLGCLKP